MGLRVLTPFLLLCWRFWVMSKSSVSSGHLDCDTVFFQVGIHGNTSIQKTPETILSCYPQLQKLDSHTLSSKYCRRQSLGETNNWPVTYIRGKKKKQVHTTARSHKAKLKSGPWRIQGFQSLNCKFLPSFTRQTNPSDSAHTIQTQRILPIHPLAMISPSPEAVSQTWINYMCKEIW